MKPIKPASERDHERVQAAEAARIAILIGDITGQLESAGWTNIRVQKKGPFIAVSAQDPTGTSHSGAMEDGQALTDFLIRIGVAPPPRTRGVAPANPERLAPIRTPSAEPVMTAADRAALEAERDEAREAIAIALKDIERLKQEKSELESRPPEVREVRVEVPAPVVAEEGEGEPMPDALRDSLARLVEPDANEAAKKAALMTRWINLKAQMEDMKLPERDRVLPPISVAEIAEFEQLEAYMSWFK